MLIQELGLLIVQRKGHCLWSTQTHSQIPAPSRWHPFEPAYWSVIRDSDTLPMSLDGVQLKLWNQPGLLRSRVKVSVAQRSGTGTSLAERRFLTLCPDAQLTEACEEDQMQGAP